MYHGETKGMIHVEDHALVGLSVDAQRLVEVLGKVDGVVGVDVGEVGIYRAVNQWIVLMRRQVGPACGQVVGGDGHGGVDGPLPLGLFLRIRHNSNRHAEP